MTKSEQNQPNVRYSIVVFLICRTGRYHYAQENPPLEEQPPNGLPRGADLLEAILKLDAEMVFLTFLLSHSGQVTFARANVELEVSSDSKDFLQSWQRYS